MSEPWLGSDTSVVVSKPKESNANGDRGFLEFFGILAIVQGLRALIKPGRA